MFVSDLIGQDDERLKKIQKDIETARDDKNDRKLSEKLNDLGWHYAGYGLPECLEAFQESLDIALKISDQDLIALNYYSIGEYYQVIKKTREAETYFYKVLDFPDSPSIRFSKARSKIELAENRHQAKDYKSAIELSESIHNYLIVRTIRNRAGPYFVHLLLNSTLNLSSSYRQIGNYFLALHYLKEAELYAEKLTPREIFSVKIQLLRLYGGLGNVPKTLDYQAKIETFLRENPSPDFEREFYSTIGTVKLYQKDYQTAERFYQKATAITTYTDLSLVLGKAQIQIEKDNIESARSILLDGLDFALESKSENYQGIIYWKLGEVHQRKNNLLEATNYYQKSLEIAEKNSLLQIKSLVLNNLGEIALVKDDYAIAESRFKEAIYLSEQIRSQLGDLGAKILFLESRIRPFENLIEALSKQNKTDEALRLSDKLHNRALTEKIFDNTYFEIPAIDTATGEKVHLETIELIKQFFAKGADSKTYNEDAAVIEQKTRQLTTIYTSPIPLKPILTDDFSLSQLAQNIAAEEAVVQYKINTDRVFVWVITKEQSKSPRFVEIPLSERELSKEITRFKIQLSSLDFDYQDLAKKLYRKIISPLENHIKTKKRLILIPDKTLWELPFQALIGADNRFLIEKYSVSFSPSLKWTNDNRGVLQKAERILFAGPPSVNSREFSPLKDMPLVRSSFERKIGQKIESLKNDNLTFGNLEKKLGDKSLIHFYTHGVFDKRTNDEPSLLMSDGLLQKGDITKLSLRSELVTLAACQTAVGKMQKGEGLISLSWAFLYAGARKTLVSNWKVDSDTTDNLMTNFYDAVLPNRLDNSDYSLQQAQIKMLKNPKSRHPFYWAGFVLIGNS